MSKNITRNIRVKIIDNGKVYSSYTDMAKLMKLKHWKSTPMNEVDLIKNQFGTLITMKQHLRESIILTGVRLDNGKDIIISLDGISFI